MSRFLKVFQLERGRNTLELRQYNFLTGVSNHHACAHLFPLLSTLKAHSLSSSPNVVPFVKSSLKPYLAFFILCFPPSLYPHHFYVQIFPLSVLSVCFSHCTVDSLRGGIVVHSSLHTLTTRQYHSTYSMTI